MADGGIGNQSPATLFQARLDTTDGTSNTLTLLRYVGNKVTISGQSLVIPSGGLTRDIADNLIDASGADAGSAPVASTLYYVYASNGRASFSPLSIRLSSQPPLLVNGVLYLGASGNALNWRFVGWVMPNATPQFESTRGSRLIVNYYNRLRLDLFTNPGYVDDDAYTSYTLNSATFVQLNGGSGASVSFISNGEDEVHLEMVFATTTPNGISAFPGISVDSTVNALVSAICGSGSVGINETSVLVYDKIIPSGSHVAYMIGYSNGPVTVYADGIRAGAAADPPMTVLSGFIQG